MAVAQGSCPSCGSPIEFGLGASIAKVCPACKATVVRTDRGLENLGRVAEIADTPSLVAVGDQGTLAGRPIEILGRVQLEWKLGPWDEYYVSFDHGASWGWLAYAQGRWHVTSATAPLPLPDFRQLSLELDLNLPGLGFYRVAELRSATIRSAEGELPEVFPQGFVRTYADCYGPEGRFATLDYGDGRSAPTLFVGSIIPESQLKITALGPRTTNQVGTTYLRCPNCGGDVPKMGGNRSERLGCPYCGAMSDIAERRTISLQERLLEALDIPIGSTGTFDGVEYLCLAFVRRSSVFDDETYTWAEFLLFAPSVGYRWLVKDPETGWLWAMAISPADLDLRQAPGRVGYFGLTYGLRNQNEATVEYVVGEIYWKCEIGERVKLRDYTAKKNALSREEIPGEVNWSYSVPVDWNVIAGAFGLPVNGPGNQGFTRTSGGSGGSSGSGDDGLSPVAKAIMLIVFLVICIGVASLAEGGSSGIGIGVSGGSYRGGGTYYGGK
jgi:hypothetical protein